MADDLMDRITTTGTRVAVNLVEIMSLRTPKAPLDLQVLLEDDRSRAPVGTQVEVQARTNLSLSLLDLVDLTYSMPPLSVALSAPLTPEQAAANNATKLFTVGVPQMEKYDIHGPLLVDANVSIGNIYESATWLEDLMLNLSDKWVYAQPIYKGDVWSYMIEPLRLRINVQDAINSNNPDLQQSGASGILTTNQSTWSKIYFSLKVPTHPGPDSDLDVNPYHFPFTVLPFV